MKNTQSITLKSTLINAAVISALSLTPMFAMAKTTTETHEATSLKAQAQKNEGLGAGAGIIIGGIFGGPFGAFFTGIAGNFIAKHMNAHDEITTLKTTLTAERSVNDQQLAAFKKQFQQAEQDYQRELSALNHDYLQASQAQTENLMMSLQFSTGASDIAPHYQAQISSLAQFLKHAPRVTINLSGYTDLQGSEQLNATLSKARVASVKQALIAQGIEEERIATFAYGETAPVVARADREVSFYDRRVVIKLGSDVEQMAKNDY